MKICLIGPTYPLRGGIAHHTSLLAGALRKEHEVLLISMRRQYLDLLFPGRTQDDTSSRRPISTANLPLLDSILPWTWFRGGRRIRRFEPDCVVFQWWHPFFAPMYTAVAACSGQNGPLLFICHNVLPHDRSKVDKALVRMAFRKVDGFIIHAEADREKLHSIRPGAKVLRTPHPEYAVFKELSTVTRREARSRLGLHGPVILFFGYIRPYKGLKLLLEAMAIMRRSFDCTLVVAGEFYEDRSAYDHLVAEYSLTDRVRFADHYIPNEEVATYFRAADLVVFPYLSATQSGILQVAYGFDMPVVATDVGGIGEAVRHGETGLIVPPENPEAMAAAILRFFRDNLGADFSEKIKAGRMEFRWDRLVRVIEEFSL